MTGKKLIDNFLSSYSFTEKETVGKALSYCIDEELHKISDGKLDLDKELTSKDLKQLLNAINKDLKMNNIFGSLIEAAEILDADVLKFFAENPNYLADVEKLADAATFPARNIDSCKLLDNFMYVFACAVEERVVAFKNTTLQDALKRTEQLEKWAQEEER